MQLTCKKADPQPEAAGAAAAEEAGVPVCGGGVGSDDTEGAA